MVKLTNPRTSSAVLQQLLWAAMHKIGQKELMSDKLPESTDHRVDLRVTGTIDGRSISKSIEAVVAIGESQTKTSSVNPQMPELLAWVLSKLNAATRTRILEDIPSEFAELGKMPESSKVLVGEANELLKQLRQTKTVSARGPIRCQYTLNEHAADSRLPS